MSQISNLEQLVVSRYQKIRYDRRNGFEQPWHSGFYGIHHRDNWPAAPRSNIGGGMSPPVGESVQFASGPDYQSIGQNIYETQIKPNFGGWVNEIEKITHEESYGHYTLLTGIVDNTPIVQRIRDDGDHFNIETMAFNVYESGRRGHPVWSVLVNEHVYQEPTVQQMKSWGFDDARKLLRDPKY